MSDPAIVMDGLCRSFGKRKVLAGITGEIERGRTVGLLGENGEGKTTLFRVLLDILAPDSGSALILNRPADGSGRIRRYVGYVPERPVFHEFLDLGGVLKMREPLYPAWNREKAAAAARRLKLDLSTPMRGASKGTLARTAWICATAHSPDVLLLDEPTSGLDPLVRDSVLTQLVSELSNEGKTIFVANHRMEEMLAVLDEVWVLSGGVIREKHSLDSLRENGIRITGKLKSGMPADLRVFEEHRSGNLVRWAILDATTLDRVRHLNLLEQMEMEPLPLDITFKLLLARKEEKHVH